MKVGKKKGVSSASSMCILGGTTLPKCRANLDVGAYVMRKDRTFIVTLNYNSRAKVHGAPTMCQAKMRF